MKKRSTDEGKWPRRIAMVMAFFALLFFGGGYYLNHKYLIDEANNYKFITPIDGQKYWTSEQKQFRFEWSGLTDDDDLLEVARDPDFKDKVMESGGSQTPLLTDKIPGDGEYFCRIKRRIGSKDVVLVAPVRFTVVTKTPPSLIYPFGDMKLQDGKPIRFIWQPKRGVAKYRFQISFDKSFENLLVNLVFSTTQTSPQTLPLGELYWRVRAEDDDKNFTQWSNTNQLMVEKPSTLAADSSAPTPTASPQVVAAEPATPKALPGPSIEKMLQKNTLKFKSSRSTNPPTLSWNKVKNANSYEVQVSLKDDFTKIEWSTTSKKTKTTWNSARPGHYFWRVRANLNGKTKSDYSDVANLELSLPAPTLKNKISHSIKLKKPAEMSVASQVPLTWSKVPGASSYKVIVSENKKFNSTKVDLKVSRNNAKLPLMNGGRFFVKVAALNENGDIVSDYSKVSTLNFDKRAPASEEPKPTPAAEKKSKPTPTPRASEPPREPKTELEAPSLMLPPDGVSIVSMNGNQDSILFKWSPIKNAGIYRIEVSSNRNFKSTTYTSVSLEPQVLVTTTLPKGRSYWRVRAEKEASKSAWSQTFSIEK